ncbi:unnamed protein product [Musa acuminata subsp. malaccensis]|uniref:(wild Malaysian banana) hypothetical protein n=1 Tax=Musa acuminata subsp. malaccensis TaxID=214687 RepID=A0A8D6ZX82_MUSAM|nr:unnamed protein product [Musa acuminata subsp. malaccensis]
MTHERSPLIPSILENLEELPLEVLAFNIFLQHTDVPMSKILSAFLNMQSSIK